MNSGLPIIQTLDPVDRDIQFYPSKAPYDPRHMLAGRTDPVTNKWESGFFDENSWMEIMQKWAQSVVVGRARYVSNFHVSGKQLTKLIIDLRIL